MSNILLPKRSLSFYCLHKVTILPYPRPLLRSLQPNPAFHINWVATVSWRKVGDLRTSLTPALSPCSCSLQTHSDPHSLRMRFLKYFSRKILSTTLNYETQKQCCCSDQSKRQGPRAFCARPPLGTAILAGNSPLRNSPFLKTLNQGSQLIPAFPELSGF